MTASDIEFSCGAAVTADDKMYSRASFVGTTGFATGCSESTSPRASPDYISYSFQHKPAAVLAL